jgi:putative endonuclease
MDVFTVYILFSKKHAKTYLGYTSNLLARFHSHNSLANKGYTIKFRPWEVIHCEVYYTKSEAIKREKFLKSGKGREYTKQIMRDLGLISA